MSCWASVAAPSAPCSCAPVAWAPSSPLRIATVAIATTTAPTITSISAEPALARLRARPAAYNAATGRARRRAREQRLVRVNRSHASIDLIGDIRVPLEEDTAHRGEPSWLNRAMTATLPAEVQQVFDRFVTTEFTTVDGPRPADHLAADPLLPAGDPCIDVTTGLGYPKKATTPRANPKVALLFSDPTGSGSRARRRCSCRAPPTSTTATSTPTASATSARAREAARHQARCAAEGRSSASSAGTSTRIYIHVRPERIYVWADGDSPREPRLFDAHMEEVRSGHDEEPDAEHPRRRGGAAWDERMDELGARYPRRCSARRARRLPVLRAGAVGSTAAAARAAGRRAASACRCSRAAPASPRTTTRPTSRGSATSRCAATSSRRTAAGRHPAQADRRLRAAAVEKMAALRANAGRSCATGSTAREEMRRRSSQTPR